MERPLTNKLIPCNIDAILPEIKSQLEDACKHITDPQEVIEECRVGQSYILRTEDKTGFVVLRVELHRVTNKLELYVWVGARTGDNSLDTYLPELEHIARCLGAETIAFSTKRRGYSRKLSKKWKLRQAEYEYKVNQRG